MGHRLSKIYTRTGDDGSTGLGDGARVSKDAARVAAYGCVDETNSAIGVVLACDLPDAVREVLTRVQHQLFDLGGELCIPGHAAIDDADVTHLETTLDRFNQDLPPLKDFILPGGGMAAAQCHLARTICRRAERVLVTLARTAHSPTASADPSTVAQAAPAGALAQQDTVRAQAIRYLNRLSDLLFVLARVLARHDGHGEVLWDHQRRRST